MWAKLQHQPNLSKSKAGFTIVELLIVIVIIGILAAIVIVAYNGVQTRAKASAIISELEGAEKAFRSYTIVSGASSWWIDGNAALTGVSNPSITSIIAAQPSFRDFLQRAPTTNGMNTANNWIYDNDGDANTGCTGGTAGVNIGITAASNEVMQSIDSTIDDGNLTCGKVRYSGGWFLYTISNDSTL